MCQWITEVAGFFASAGGRAHTSLRNGQPIQETLGLVYFVADLGVLGDHCRELLTQRCVLSVKVRGLHRYSARAAVVTTTRSPQHYRLQCGLCSFEALIDKLAVG
jgi:hypothetical protein